MHFFHETIVYSRGNASYAGCVYALKLDPAVQELKKTNQTKTYPHQTKTPKPKQFIDQENGPGGIFKEQ